MENNIYQIYDKIFKKILTLSSTAVINLINGLFETDYPLDSTIQYNWTEFMDDTLKRILADTILTINGKHSYHLEAQMTKDNDIIFRVFEYGFSHANHNNIQDDDYYELTFPEPKIIYLCPENNLPDKYVLRLNFGSQGYFDYKVNTCCFNQISTAEMNSRKMVILIPFKLLKLRKKLEKSRCRDNLIALKNLILNDIIGSIEDNLRLQNITLDDARKLKRLTHRLYQHIYAHYDEMEVLNEMTDESLMLDIDYIEKEHELQLENLKKQFEQELSDVQKLHEQRLSDAKRLHEQTLSDAKRLHEKVLSKEKKLHEKALLEERKRYEEEIARLKALLEK